MGTNVFTIKLQYILHNLETGRGLEHKEECKIDGSVFTITQT